MAKGSGKTRMRGPSLKRTILKNKNTEKIIYLNNLASDASERLSKIIADKKRDGFTRDNVQFKFGTLPNLLADKYEKMTGEKIENKDMYTGASSLLHHRGGQKAEKGKETPLEDISTMPMRIMSMDVFVYKNSLVFTDYKNKFVLKPNQRVKTEDGKIIVTNHVSSSKLKDKNVFTRANGYRKINP